MRVTARPRPSWRTESPKTVARVAPIRTASAAAAGAAGAADGATGAAARVKVSRPRTGMAKTMKASRTNSSTVSSPRWPMRSPISAAALARRKHRSSRRRRHRSPSSRWRVSPSLRRAQPEPAAPEPPAPAEPPRRRSTVREPAPMFSSGAMSDVQAAPAPAPVSAPEPSISYAGARSRRSAGGSKAAPLRLVEPARITCRDEERVGR